MDFFHITNLPTLLSIHFSKICHCLKAFWILLQKYTDFQKLSKTSRNPGEFPIKYSLLKSYVFSPTIVSRLTSICCPYCSAHCEPSVDMRNPCTRSNAVTAGILECFSWFSTSLRESFASGSKVLSVFWWRVDMLVAI